MDQIEHYLNSTFRIGDKCPRYNSIYDGQNHVPDDWDSLERLLLTIALTKRRYDETNAMALNTIKTFLPMISGSKILSDFTKKFAITKFRPTTKLFGVEIDPFKIFDVGRALTLSIVSSINSIIDAISPPPAAEATLRKREALSRTWTAKFLTLFTGKGLDEIASEAVTDAIIVAGEKIFMQDIYINLQTAPTLVWAVQQAEARNIKGGTQAVIRLLNAFDQQVSADIKGKNDLFSDTSSLAGSFNGFKGAADGIKGYAEEVQKLEVLAGNVEAKVSANAKFFSASGAFFAKAFKYLQLLEAAHALETIYVTLPGEVAYGADQSFNCDLTRQAIPLEFVLSLSKTSPLD